MNKSKIITSIVVLSLIGTPALCLAKARGGGGGGYSGGSRSGSTPGSIGSRGARTHDENGFRPIERSTTPKPSAVPSQPASSSPTPAAQSVPARQPSFLQQHPLLSGIAGGIAGSWIGHMLFGATDSVARTSDADGRDGARETDPATGTSGSMGTILIFMLLGGAAWYYFTRLRRKPEPSFAGIPHGAVSGAPLTRMSLENAQSSAPMADLTPADHMAFEQSLIEVQAAWSKQDLGALRRLVTPEMLSYFSTALSEHTSQEVENHVEDVTVLSTEARETWTEDATDYATVLLRWKARDYTRSLTKQRGEAGFLTEGNDQVPTESSEVWTFMRYQKGKWLLSAIQQTN